MNKFNLWEDVIFNNGITKEQCWITEYVEKDGFTHYLCQDLNGLKFLAEEEHLFKIEEAEEETTDLDQFMEYINENID